MSPPPAPSTPHPSPSHAPIETLLAHREWVRALARTLVRDESAADDIEQQTWQAALENPPRKEGSVRAWLGSVVRRTVLDSQRRHVRRQRREVAAARPEGLPATSDVVARVEIDRAVVNVVAELPEPYRTTLLLRFYDGLPPRDVAARMGVPVETVRSRVRRGLERVRTGLDASHGGDRGVWTAALVPFLAGPAGLGPAGAPATDGGSGTASISSTATGTSAAVIAVVVVGALALGSVVGYRMESQVGSGASSGMSPGDALLTAERALEDERRDLANLSARVDAFRARERDLETQLAALSSGADDGEASAATSPDATQIGPVGVPRAPFERSLSFPEYDAVLSRVDWDEFGHHVSRMIPLLGELYVDRRDGRSLRPEAIGQLQVHNGAVVAVVGPLEEDFPGNAANAALTHPAFTATMTAALCHACDLPLDREQLTALDRIAKDAADAVDRVVDGASGRAFRLDAIIEESEIKSDFVDALRGLLTPEQQALLGVDAMRDIVGFDLFGPGQTWVGSIECGRFSAETDVAAVISRGMSRALGLDDDVRPELKRVIGEWLESLPEGYLAQPVDPVRELETAQPVDAVLEAARHMRDLMRRVAELDLSDEQRASIRRSNEVLILRRKP